MGVCYSKGGKGSPGELPAGYSVSDAEGTFDFKYVRDKGYAPPPDEPLFHLRGENYLHDRVKIPWDKECLLELVASDLFRHDEKPCEHISEDPRSFLSLHPNHAPWTFVMHLISPGPPWFSIGFYFIPSGGRTLEELLASSTSGSRLFGKCLKNEPQNTNMESEWRRVKLITAFTEAPLMVWSTLGSTPILSESHPHCYVYILKGFNPLLYAVKIAW